MTIVSHAGSVAKFISVRVLFFLSATVPCITPIRGFGLSLLLSDRSQQGLCLQCLLNHFLVIFIFVTILRLKFHSGLFILGVFLEVVSSLILRNSADVDIFTFFS